MTKSVEMILRISKLIKKRATEHDMRGRKNSDLMYDFIFLKNPEMGRLVGSGRSISLKEKLKKIFLNFLKFLFFDYWLVVKIRAE